MTKDFQMLQTQVRLYNLKAGCIIYENISSSIYRERKDFNEQAHLACLL